MTLVKCECCGFVGNIHDYHIWTKEGSRYPQLWICDICAIELR